MRALAARPGATAAALAAVVRGDAEQPNELDLRRIVRQLRQRARYRYVRPLVDCCAGGYRIQSPCCSRNVDPGGGVIDIALLKYQAGPGSWALYRKDHGSGQWLPQLLAARLDQALDLLNRDPQRVFWR